MDLPFVYTNSLWPFYHPLPRQQRSRLPSISRGRVYEATPLTAARQQRRQSANAPSSRYHNAPSRRRTSNSSSNSSNSTHLLAHPTTPNRGRQSNSRAMQAPSGSGALRAAATVVPRRSSAPHLVWAPTRFDTNRPSLSFSRAATDLAATLDAALGYIRPIYDKFSDETKEVRRYADQTVMDQLWVKRIWDDSTQEGQRDGTNAAHEQGEGVGEDGRHAGSNRIETPAARLFRDHQAAVQNRCKDILCAIPPPALPIQNQPRGQGRGTVTDISSSNSSSSSSNNSDRSIEAAALVAKMSRCREDVSPALRRMDSRYAVVGPAIKEMEVLRASLETYRVVWDSTGEEGGG